jgi:hypothetical protein
MCCFTHGNPAVPGELASDARLRCRCSCGGVPCLRQASAEDFLCDACRHGGVPDADGLVSPYAFRPPLRYERSLIEGYRLGLAVARPGSLVVVTGI